MPWRRPAEAPPVARVYLYHGTTGVPFQRGRGLTAVAKVRPRWRPACRGEPRAGAAPGVPAPRLTPHAGLQPGCPARCHRELARQGGGQERSAHRGEDTKATAGGTRGASQRRGHPQQCSRHEGGRPRSRDGRGPVHHVAEPCRGDAGCPKSRDLPVPSRTGSLLAPTAAPDHGSSCCTRRGPGCQPRAAGAWHGAAEPTHIPGARPSATSTSLPGRCAVRCPGCGRRPS